jgi:hypothetical protein
MKPNTHDIEIEQAKERLRLVDDPKVIDQLYSFGERLLSEARERSVRIESKAFNVLTWSIAIVAFIFSQVNSATKTITSAKILLTAAVLSIVALAFSYCVIKSRNNSTCSDEDWMRKDCLDSPDDLKMFHVRSIHKVRHESLIVSDRKSIWLLCAETSLMLSGITLFAGISLLLFCKI